MTTENLAILATHSPQLHLEEYPEFVGVGVMPKRPKSNDMVVAIYVSKPRQHLSWDFKSRVPPSIEVVDAGRHVNVLTRIVNVGKLEL